MESFVSSHFPASPVALTVIGRFGHTPPVQQPSHLPPMIFPRPEATASGVEQARHLFGSNRLAINPPDVPIEFLGRTAREVSVMIVPQTEIIITKDGVEIARKTVTPGEYVFGRGRDAMLLPEELRVRATRSGRSRLRAGWARFFRHPTAPPWED